MTLVSRLRASRPPTPPTSRLEIAPASLVSEPSEAGIETTKTAPGVPLTASKRDWAKLNCESKLPPGRWDFSYSPRA